GTRVLWSGKRNRAPGVCWSAAVRPPRARAEAAGSDPCIPPPIRAPERLDPDQERLRRAEGPSRSGDVRVGVSSIMDPVRIIDVSYVTVPADAAAPPPPEGIKLNAMEAQWLLLPLLQHVLFFEGDNLPPFDTLVQSLRRSLSATLST
ncbi:unnamed protein product, partial [Urochloa humidicola]